MQWPRPRFKLRTLLLLIATSTLIAAGAAYAFKLWEKSADYRNTAEFWDDRVRSSAILVASYEATARMCEMMADAAGEPKDGIGGWRFRAVLQNNDLVIHRKYHATSIQFRDIYRRLADHPWEEEPPFPIDLTRPKDGLFTITIPPPPRGLRGLKEQ